jgi:hypothetical protein
VFLTIKEKTKETIVYEYGTPSRTIQRAVRAEHALIWRSLGFLLFILGGILLVMAFYGMVSTTLDHPTHDLSDARFIGYLLSMIPGIVFTSAGFESFATVRRIRDAKRDVTRQHMRDLYVTEKDGSFKVIFPSGSATDLSNPVLKQAVDEYLANPDVIKADRIIRESTTSTKKAVKVYNAKLKLIYLAQAMYLSIDLATYDVLGEFAQQRASLDKDMHTQLLKALDAFDVRRRRIQALVTRTQPSAAIQ